MDVTREIVTYLRLNEAIKDLHAECEARMEPLIKERGEIMHAIKDRLLPDIDFGRPKHTWVVFSPGFRVTFTECGGDDFGVAVEQIKEEATADYTA